MDSLFMTLYFGLKKLVCLLTQPKALMAGVDMSLSTPAPHHHWCVLPLEVALHGFLAA